MDGLHLRANAKINLSLDILGRRPDGYHEMDMVKMCIRDRNCEAQNRL